MHAKRTCKLFDHAHQNDEPRVGSHLKELASFCEVGLNLISVVRYSQILLATTSTCTLPGGEYSPYWINLHILCIHGQLKGEGRHMPLVPLCWIHLWSVHVYALNESGLHRYMYIVTFMLNFCYSPSPLNVHAPGNDFLLPFTPFLKSYHNIKSSNF